MSCCDLNLTVQKNADKSLVISGKGLDLTVYDPVMRIWRGEGGATSPLLVVSRTPTGGGSSFSNSTTGLLGTIRKDDVSDLSTSDAPDDLFYDIVLDDGSGNTSAFVGGVLTWFPDGSFGQNDEAARFTASIGPQTFNVMLQSVAIGASDSALVQEALDTAEEALDATLNKANVNGSNIAAPNTFRAFLNIQEVAPEDYDANAGDGGDDYAALQSAVTAAVSLGRVLRLSRIYRCNSTLTASGGSLSITGPSPESAGIIFYSNAGLTFQGGTPTEYAVDRFSASGVRFWTQGQSTRSVLRLEYVGGSGSTASTVTMSDVDIRGADATSGFTYGIDCFNVRNASFSRIVGMGDRGNDSGAGNVNTLGFIRLDGDSDPVEITLSEVQAYFVRTALTIRGQCEGIYTYSNKFVRVNIGIDSSNVGGEPLLIVSDSHINSYDYGVLLNNRLQFAVTGNLFYGQDGMDYVGILVNTDNGLSANGEISGNNFQDFDATTSSAIVIQGASGTDSVTIDANRIENYTTGIWLKPDCNGATIGTENRFLGCVTNILNQGTGNFVGTVTPVGGKWVGQRAAGGSVEIEPKSDGTLLVQGRGVSDVLVGLSVGGAAGNIVVPTIAGVGVGNQVSIGSTSIPFKEIVVANIGDGTGERAISSPALSFPIYFDNVGVVEGTGGDGAANSAALSAAFVTYPDRTIRPRDGALYNFNSRVNVPTLSRIAGDSAANRAIMVMKSAGFTNTTAARFGTNACLFRSFGTSPTFEEMDGVAFENIIIQNERLVDGRHLVGIGVRNGKDTKINNVDVTGLPTGFGISLSGMHGDWGVEGGHIYDFTSNINTPGLGFNMTGVDVDNDISNSNYSEGGYIHNVTINDLTPGATFIAAFGDQSDGVTIAKDLTRATRISDMEIYNVNEGLDIFGLEINVNGGVYTDCRGGGIKLINGAKRCVINSPTVVRAGRTGVSFAGSPANGSCDRNTMTGGFISVGTINEPGDVSAILLHPNGGTTFQATNTLITGVTCVSDGAFADYGWLDLAPTGVAANNIGEGISFQGTWASRRVFIPAAASGSVRLAGTSTYVTDLV